MDGQIVTVFSSFGIHSNPHSLTFCYNFAKGIPRLFTQTSELDQRRYIQKDIPKVHYQIKPFWHLYLVNIWWKGRCQTAPAQTLPRVHLLPNLVIRPSQFRSLQIN